MPDQVLIVDDDPTQRRLLEATVGKLGFSPMVADGGERALQLVEGNVSELRAIVLDLMMPGMDGMEVMRRMHRRGLRVPIIVQTASGGIETAVAAMRAGAFDFVVKPVSPDRLAEAINGALKVEALQQQRESKSGKDISVREIVTRSAAMEMTLSVARKAAASDIPVIIEGESGVGKELIARAIRGESRRRRKPFITVNCGAIPDNLVESILFGHEKGAFTGATERHVGKFVEADGGTLFLDEIGDLPASVQVKLLRAVQEGEVDPIGARGSVKVDIRLISATNQNLAEEVRQGRFREDLYYRLNVFPIHVPPLRDRKDDIPLIVQHFITRFADAVPGRRISGISSRALEILSAYDWPGNVRELENAIFRAIVLCDRDVLTIQEFPQIQAQVEGIAATVPAPAPVQYAADHPETAMAAHVPGFLQEEGFLAALRHDGHVRTLEEIEHEMILFAIDRYGSQMSEVARRLGIGRSTLYRKLKELGIDHVEQRG
jgi:DNA-binding NtrC family response regulator